MTGIFSFLEHRRRKRTRKLYDEATELLDERRYDDALAIASKLRKTRFSGAYEIEARAFVAMDRGEDAVRVLREGLEIAPNVGRLWHFLGTVLSDLGRYDEALDALDRAANCEGMNHASIALNRAIVYGRMKRHDDALCELDSVGAWESEEMRLRAIGARVDAMRGLGRLDEAEALGVRALREWRESEDDSANKAAGLVAFAVCRIRQARGQDARASAIEWWQQTYADDLLWLIRDLRLVRSPDAKYFRILVHGTPEDPEAGIGYYVKADVVADTQEEALELYRELRPDPTLTIHESEIVEVQPDGVKGVYWMSGRAYYHEN